MIQRTCLAALLVLSCATPRAMAQSDQADLGLWQMVQSQNTPNAYKIYLEAFPNGKFAALARLRSQGAAPTPAPAAAPADADPDEPQFTVTPQVARIGQKFTVNCGTLPSGGPSDTIIVVPAGSPPNPTTALTQGIQKEYLRNCFIPSSNSTLQLGPLPPGRWEFRWMTSLYNLENRQEVKAKVDVTVR